MLKRIIILLILTVQMSISAQNYKFGKVSKEELEEEFYPLDSTANAAYLYKNRRTYYKYNNNSGFEIVNDIHIRLKIYSKEGFDNATFELPYVRSKSGEPEKISSIKAYTYNLSESGKIQEDKLSKKNVFDKTVSKFRHIKSITMPNLKEGSVVELKYTLSSPYTNYIDDLQFQYSIPVKKLLIDIETPEWLVFAKKNKGFFLIAPKESKRNGSISFKNKVRTTTKYNTSSAGGGFNATSTSYENNKQELAYNISEYEGENIPALKNNESFVFNANAYRGGVKYELVGTKYPNSAPKNFSKSWDDVTKQIYKSESFGKELEKQKYFKKDIDILLQTTSSEVDKLAKIFQYVKSTVKWNGYYNKYTNEGVRKAYETKTGNSAEINLMLTAMLRYAGLNANPVLVSSKGNGVPLFPTIKGFDYVISSVKTADNSFVLLDATEPFSTPNTLPSRVLNWDGRLVTATGESTWVKLNSIKHSSEENMALVKISEDLDISGFVRTKLDNLFALNFRKKNNHLKNEVLIEKYEDDNNVEVEDFKIQNEKVLDKPIIRNVKFISEDLIETIGDKIYIEPAFFLTKRKSPFKVEERKYPVDFIVPWKESNKVTIQIPEGYKIESVPESMAIALPDNLGVFKYQIVKGVNKIKTISILQFNQPTLSPQYYPYLKDFYGKLVKKESEKIVLSKM